MQVLYKGVTTKQLYKFMSGVVPAALQSSQGNPLAIGTYNGETVILTDTDGSVARGVATGPPAGASTVPAAKSGGVDIYSAYAQPSLWEQQQA